MRIGDIAIMRKPHACGGSEWEIVRIGSDIGVRCQKCGHKVLMDRAYFRKNVKKYKALEEEK